MERKISVAEWQFQVVERQTQVAEWRSGLFQLHVITARYIVSLCDKCVVVIKWVVVILGTDSCRCCHDSETVNILTALNLISNWARDWQLGISINKCSVLSRGHN